MSKIVDLSIAKKNLANELGEKMNEYLQLLKSWFKCKRSRETFDFEARQLFTADNIHLHNQFMLAILAKCQSIGTSMGGDQSNQGNDYQLRKEKAKRKLTVCSIALYQKFLPADPLSVAPIIQPQFPEQNERVPDYASREMLVPDIALIHGRLIVTAWEFGLEAVEDMSVGILLQAVQIQLKNLISAVLSRRRGYRLYGKRFKHSMSTCLPSESRLRAAFPFGESQHCDSDIYNRTTDAEKTKYSQAMTSEIIEKSTVLQLAASDMNSEKREPINLFDLLEALQVNKSVIPSHSVYTLGIERILDRLNHPSHEELLHDNIHKQEIYLKNSAVQQNST